MGEILTSEGVYEINPIDIMDLVRKIIEEKKFNFAEKMDLTEIQFIRVKNKKKRKYADVRMVKYPTILFTNKKYLISIYDSFYILPKNKQEIVLAHEILHIDFENNKLIDHDIQDFKEIIEMYGVDWELR